MDSRILERNIMTKKSFGGEDFGLGLDTVKQAAPKQEKPILSVSSSREYKRNSFGGGENMKQVAFSIDKANANKFKVICAMQNTSASVVINDFIGKYLTENSK
jgi:hypothetical protein